jgi:hypothetical protein
MSSVSHPTTFLVKKIFLVGSELGRVVNRIVGGEVDAAPEGSETWHSPRSNEVKPGFHYL